ncbi:unnamed protein product [Effrenium voratum]|nr:unnamed protein product [Effrenium voratum]
MQSPADEARQSSASPRSISPEKTALRSPRLMWQVPSKSSAGPLPPAQPDGLSPRWNGREMQSFQPHSLLRERDLTPRRTPRGVVFPQPVVSQSGFGLAVPHPAMPSHAQVPTVLLRPVSPAPAHRSLTPVAVPRGPPVFYAQASSLWPSSLSYA